MTRFAQLPKRAFFRLSGEDAVNFLQGLVTIDTLKMQAGDVRYGALLTPQGKFLHDFFLLREQESFLLETDSQRADELAARLKRYRLRAKVEIESQEKLTAFALWDGEPPPSTGIRVYADPRYAPLGFRIAGLEGEILRWLGGMPESEASYSMHRLSLGVPESDTDLLPEQSLPLECGMDRLHGIDFDKGCYVGQEVTARTKFRAHLRKQFYIVHANAPLPPPGTPVKNGDVAAGELRSSLKGLGLAMLNNEKTGDGPLRAEGVLLVRESPPWLATEPA